MKALIILLGIFTVQSFAKDIRVSVSHFPPYIDKSKKGHGIYAEYLSNFFKKTGHEVKYNFAPFARNLKNLELKKETDITIIGTRAYPEVLRKVPIHKTEVFDEVKYCIFYKKSIYPKGIEGKKIEDLGKPPIISIIGMPLNKTLKKHQAQLFKATTFPGAFKMLMRERGKLFVNSEVIGKHYLKQLGLDKEIGCAYYPLSEKIILITPHKKIKNKFFPLFNNYIKNVPIESYKKHYINN